jgi:hypothetical protein
LWGDLESDKGFNILKIQFEELYMRVMLVCELSFAPSSNESYNKIGLAQQMFDGGKEKFLKLKSDLILNSIIIDPLVLLQLTKIMDAFDNILERARFLINLHNLELEKYYFISEIPEEDFNLVYDFLYKIKVFEDYAIKSKKHYLPNEIITNWKAAEKENKRYSSNPAEFKGELELVPFVFNLNTMRSLQYPAIEIKVFKDTN